MLKISKILHLIFQMFEFLCQKRAEMHKIWNSLIFCLTQYLWIIRKLHKSPTDEKKIAVKGSLLVNMSILREGETQNIITNAKFKIF